MNKENAVRLIQGLAIVLHRFKYPRQLNRSVRLIKVTFVWLIWDSIRNFANCPLNTGCPFNGGPLNRGQTYFPFFLTPKPSINHLNFYCMKQIHKIFPCVCTLNKSQRTSQRVNNNSHGTRFRLVSYIFVLCTL